MSAGTESNRMTNHNTPQATEHETSARTESNRMANQHTPQISPMDLHINCAAFPRLSRLNIRAVPDRFSRNMAPGFAQTET
jgi:hypothetical protein